jgi:hypothetical protein
MSKILKVKSDGDPFPASAGGVVRVGNTLSVNTAVNDNSIRKFARDIGDDPNAAMVRDKQIEDQDHNFNFRYRAGMRNIAAATPQSVYSDDGAIGVTVNGVPIYPPGVNYSPSSGNPSPTGLRWDAVFPDNSALDQAGGRPEGDNNEYRYRSCSFYTKGFGTPLSPNNRFKTSSPYFNDSSFSSDYMRHGVESSNGLPLGHSKIVGWALDGHPIYGPYGFTNANAPDNDSGVKVMSSGYALKSEDILENVVGRPDTFSAPRGTYTVDYFYDSSIGSDLDVFNGRYCITPEFQSGTYAYFLTFSDNNLTTPAYPYIIGEFTKEQRTLD